MLPKTSTQGTRKSAKGSAENLQFGHRWLFKKVDITTEEWNEMLFEYGDRYALLFSLMFGDKAEWLYEFLIKTVPEKNDRHNWFWMWWKMKWLQDDFAFVSDKVYQQPVTYAQWKGWMMQSEYLEVDLLNLIESKSLFKNNVNNFSK